MGRIYNAYTGNLALTNAANQDIFELMAGANNKLRLLYFELTMNVTTPSALRLRLIRRTAAGSGGNSVTVQLRDQEDSAATATFNRMVTTVGTAGDVIAEFYWDQVMPLVFLPPPQRQITVQAGDGLGLELMTAPGTPTPGLEVVWEEI